MKRSTRMNALRLILCVGFFIAIFQKPLSLPDWTEEAGAVIGLVCAISIAWMQLKAKKRAENGPAATAAAAKRGTWIVLTLIVVTGLSSPFWLPYTGIKLGFSELVVSAVVSSVICIVAFLLGVRYRRKV